LYSFVPNSHSLSWELWESFVPQSNMRLEDIIQGNTVVITKDVLLHVEIIKNWLSSDRPFILCGPPGSGKTMTLTHALSSLPQIELVALNFSSSTTSEFLVRTIFQHCKVERTAHRVFARPKTPGKSLVLFCDEINLPEADEFGTQAVVSLMRQMVERGGFWLSSSIAYKIGRAKWNSIVGGQTDVGRIWISLHKVTIVGACNPPNHPGRHPLSQRFLRQCPVLYVDFPSKESLNQIYSTYLNAMFGASKRLSEIVPSLAQAMVDVYDKNLARFDKAKQPQYIYSPRELTRWIHALLGTYFGSSEFRDEGIESNANFEEVEPTELVERSGRAVVWAKHSSASWSKWPVSPKSVRTRR
jgi:dynein heavy chain 1